MKKIDLDIKQFWKDDELAHEENCFAKTAPQVALGIRMSTECVFAELGVKGHAWDVTPREQLIEYNKRYNDIAQKAVGKRLLPENYPLPDEIFPRVKMIGEVFGGRYEVINHTTWLNSDIQTADQLKKQLDFAEKVNLRDFVLPPNWESEKKRIFEKYGHKPKLFASIRGPITLATSIYGTENLIYLYYDDPELFERFGQVILHVVMEYITLMREEAGYTEDNAPHGFSFFDDHCSLMTPDMYKALGYPVLKAVFERVSPNEGDTRFQHSDSDMAHLLPLLSDFNLTGCNFGPSLTVREIRSHMPKTRIDGQLAPFTFMRNDTEQILAEVKRDCEMAKENNSRGLNLSTAGSINNGSLLESMRLVMAGIQEYGRY